MTADEVIDKLHRESQAALMELAQVKLELAEAKVVLSYIEWAGCGSEAYDVTPSCPCCDAEEDATGGTHDADCRLAAVLGKRTALLMPG